MTKVFAGEDKVFCAPDIMEYSHYVFVTQLKK